MLFDSSLLQLLHCGFWVQIAYWHYELQEASLHRSSQQRLGLYVSQQDGKLLHSQSVLESRVVDMVPYQVSKVNV